MSNRANESRIKFTWIMLKDFFANYYIDNIKLFNFA